MFLLVDLFAVVVALSSSQALVDLTPMCTLRDISAIVVEVEGDDNEGGSIASVDMCCSSSGSTIR